MINTAADAGRAGHLRWSVRAGPSSQAERDLPGARMGGTYRPPIHPSWRRRMTKDHDRATTVCLWNTNLQAESLDYGYCIIRRVDLVS